MKHSLAFSFKNLSLLTWGFFFGYLLLLTFFSTADIYHQHFFSTGIIVTTYNLARLLFIFYLMWLLYAAGDRLLLMTAGAIYRQSMTMDTALLGFFAGIGIWHIALFFVGLAGFYTHTLMTILTLTVFMTSLPRLNLWLKTLATNHRPVYWPGLLLFLPFLILFLVTKGLYPAGGHDYYDHYFHFYRRVIDTGSILPNAIWYQFYYSKGLALFFLSMLLTDPLAPQLASTALIFAGAAMVFSIINKSASWRLLPWLGAALYIGMLIYTPGPTVNLHQGGWGDLEKTHELSAVLMLAILWINIYFIHTLAQQTNAWLAWAITLSLTVSALVLSSPVMAVFASIFLSIMALFFLWQKAKPFAWATGIAAVTAGAWFLFLLVLNYQLTGLPEDQNLLSFLPIVNLDKVKAWGVLLEILLIHWAKGAMVVQKLPLNKDFVFRAMTYLRLDVWLPLALATVTLFCVSLLKANWRTRLLAALDKKSLGILLGFLLLIATLSIFIGRDQPISFYRFTSFTYAPMLCVCLLLLAAALRNGKAALLFLVFTSGAYHFIGKARLSNENIHPKFAHYLQITMGHYNTADLGSVVKNAFRFAKGRYSIADAYRNQQGWPGRMPWGGIYPAAEMVWKQLPPKTRIWSMHVHSYCMLPDCDMESFLSFRLSPHAETIFFGDPKIAEAWLKKENLNYFFFSTKLQLTDPLPYSPLFSPQHIANYLGIAWTDGHNTLLTWKEQAQIPIDSVWLNHYNRQINESKKTMSFPYSSLRVVLNLARDKSRLKPSDLPWNIAKKG